MSIKISQDNAVLHIQFDRAEKKNAITMEMYQTMADCLATVNDNNEISTVLFSGNSECFTAGNDLKDFLEAGDFSGEAPVVQFITQLFECNKPIVAAVNGAAIGIGTTLLLHCDFVYANNSAVFATPFVNLALCPEAGSSLLLPKLVGERLGKEMLLLGRRLNAEEALQAGLITAMTDGDALHQAQKTAQQLTQLPPKALMETRRLMKSTDEALVRSTMQDEVETFSDCLQSEQAKEAFNAFFERRNPDFSRFRAG